MENEKLIDFVDDPNRNPFDEFVAQTMSGLNNLLICNEVSSHTKEMVKINRFKRWLTVFAKQQSTGNC